MMDPDSYKIMTDPDSYKIMTDPDPGSPKTYGSSGSTTLEAKVCKYLMRSQIGSKVLSYFRKGKIILPLESASSI
jgi:hypothetical protein